MRIYNSIIDTIGNTPLVKLQRLGKNLSAEIILKLEFFNPFGSVKDRIGMHMIAAAELNGNLKTGMQIIEPTSGNTGIALASVCAAKGYELTLVMPETMSQERKTILLLLGAKIILTPAKFGMKGAIAKTLELQRNNENVFVPSQFENPANPQIHRETTAQEIWYDTDGQVDFVVCGIGTGGTATGIGEILKIKKPTVKIVAVEPLESAVISGEHPTPHKIQGIGAGFIPQNLNLNIIDQIEKVSSEEAFAMAKLIIREEGIPVGISSGAAIAAALRIASLANNQGKMIVVIIPSCTERYLSTELAAQEREEAARLPVAHQELV